MKKALGLLVTLTMIVSFGFAAGSAEAPQETVYLNMGSTSSASAVYAWAVAAANAMNKPGTGLQVTVIESGAGIDNLRKIQAGTFDFALAVDVPSSYMSYKGIATFEGRPNPELRWLLMRNMIADRVYVRADSNIRVWSDLAGRRFNPGIPGSASASYMTAFNDILKTGIDLVPMALGDALNALRENRIVGLQRSSPFDAMPADLIEVNMTVPLTPVGFTRPQVTEIQKVMPFLSFVETRRGGVKEFPNAGPFFEHAAIAGGVATSKISQKVGYNIVKAYFENLVDINNAFPPSRGWDPVADFFKYVGPMSLPAHAGLVQFAKERGITVPAHLIPPEYRAR